MYTHIYIYIYLIYILYYVYTIFIHLPNASQKIIDIKFFEIIRGDLTEAPTILVPHINIPL